MKGFFSLILICIGIFLYVSFVIGGIIWCFVIMSQQGIIGPIIVAFLAPMSFIIIPFLHSLAIDHWGGMLGPLLLGNNR